jgi:rubrerythrin
MQVPPEIVVVLHRAIDKEKESIGTYLRLARIIRDANAKNVLINLAMDEVSHMTKLEEHLSRLLEGKRWVLPRAEGELEAEAARLSPSARLESMKALDEKEIARADEVRILELAIDKEVEANRQYLELARQAGTPEAKEMFLSLAKEEDLHARLLQAEIDSIGQNGFWFDMQEFTMEQ